MWSPEDRCGLEGATRLKSRRRIDLSFQVGAICGANSSGALDDIAGIVRRACPIQFDRWEASIDWIILILRYFFLRQVNGISIIEFHKTR
jgi:hypothetical protein